MIVLDEDKLRPKVVVTKDEIKIIAVAKQGPQGPIGNTGAQGPAATVAVGTVTTGNPGSNVIVTNSGTSGAAVLNFTIPRGATGIQGFDGEDSTITIGTVTTLAYDEEATVENVGTASAAILNFGIPQGIPGDIATGNPQWGELEGDITAQSDLQAAFAAKANAAHTHAISDITGLQAAIDGKAASSHTHTIGNVTGLQTALDAKQPLATALTNTTASFTTAQETKLAGIATGATANSPDATLLSRTNHTGAQAISTVTGLQTALDGKQPLNANLTATTAAFTTAQQTKLSGIATGAEVNQNAFSKVSVPGQSDIDADSKADTLNIVAGSNVTITTNASTDTITINSTAEPIADTDALIEGSTNLYFTDERAQDATLGNITGNNGIAYNYNDTTGAATIAPTFGSTANTITQGNDARLSDARTPLSHTHTASQITDFNTAADARITAQKGQNSGLATLDSGGKVPSAQLPSYIDDVKEYANLAAFPVTGLSETIYLALDTNKTYRWTGSVYVEISPSEVNSVNGQTGIITLTTSNIGEGSNLYYTDERVDDRVAALLDEGTNIGLSYNDTTGVLTVSTTATVNSSDATLLARANHTGEQAISTVTGLQTALDGKQPLDAVLTATTASFTTAQETKLAGIETAAEVNQNAFTTIAVAGQSDVVADTKTDTLTLTAGSGITLTTDAGTNTVTITNSSSGPADTDVLPEGSTNLYHTSERVDDRVAALLQAGTNITLTYDDSAGTLTIDAVSGSADPVILAGNTTNPAVPADYTTLKTFGRRAGGTRLFYNSKAEQAVMLGKDHTQGWISYHEPSGSNSFRDGGYGGNPTTTGTSGSNNANEMAIYGPHIVLSCPATTNSDAGLRLWARLYLANSGYYNTTGRFTSIFSTPTEAGSGATGFRMFTGLLSDNYIPSVTGSDGLSYAGLMFTYSTNAGNTFWMVRHRDTGAETYFATTLPFVAGNMMRSSVTLTRDPTKHIMRLDNLTNGQTTGDIEITQTLASAGNGLFGYTVIRTLSAAVRTLRLGRQQMESLGYNAV